MTYVFIVGQKYQINTEDNEQAEAIRDRIIAGTNTAEDDALIESLGENTHIIGY